MKQIISVLILIFTFCLSEFAQANQPLCPTVKINALVDPLPSRIGIYQAEISGEIDQQKVQYIWQADDGGKILLGQGTSGAAILRQELNNSTGVSVEIKGLPDGCPAKAFQGFFPVDPVRPVNFYRGEKLTAFELKSRIDSLSIALQSISSGRGFIRLPRNKELLRRIKSFISYLAFRGIDKTQVLIAISDRNENREEFWLIPNAADLPACPDCLIIPAADFEKIESLFRPK